MEVQNSKEQGIEKLEDILGRTLADILADTAFSNNDETIGNEQ